MKKILILCTGNSCRSQMAEGFIKSLGGAWQVFSAGTKPAKAVHPFAIQVMAERGMDIGAQAPKMVDEFTGMDLNYVITVCGAAEEACPVFTGRVGRRLHIGFPDPAEAAGSEEEILALFRDVRDEIIEKFTDFFINNPLQS
jgi:arsenate reductase